MKKNPVNEILVLSNPHKRGHRKHYKKSHRRHSYRRNPVMGISMHGVMSTVQDGALGAAGGLLNDAAYGYLKGMLPAPLQDGYGRIGAKLGLAVVVGMVANMAFKGKGRAIAVGAATVVLHELGKTLLNQNVPAIPLGAYEDNALLGVDSSASILQNGTGSYMRTGSYMNQGASLNGDMLPQ